MCIQPMMIGRAFEQVISLDDLVSQGFIVCDAEQKSAKDKVAENKKEREVVGYVNVFGHALNEFTFQHPVAINFCELYLLHLIYQIGIVRRFHFHVVFSEAIHDSFVLFGFKQHGSF